MHREAFVGIGTQLSILLSAAFRQSVLGFGFCMWRSLMVLYL